MTKEKPESLYSKLLRAEKNSTKEEISDNEKSKLIRVHLPAKVIAVYGQTVDVEIQGEEDTGYGEYSKFPPLLNIPLIYNNYTSSAYIITPVQIGDTGIVEFLDFNAYNFIENGNTALTGDRYYHSLNNGTFINGFIPNNKAITIPIKDNDLVSYQNNPTMLEEPTVELWDRQQVLNSDGSYSTAVSITVGIEYKGQEALAVIPTCYDGSIHTEEEAVEHFYQTNEHFGIFSDANPEAVEDYSENLHNAQARYVANSGSPISMGLHNGNFTVIVTDSGQYKHTSLNAIEFSSKIGIDITAPNINLNGIVNILSGATGTFGTIDGKTVSVSNGIITSIESYVAPQPQQS